jgi:hypothetical protein
MSKPPAQSALRYPLSELLGTEANVRLLRVLALHGGQLSAPALVFRTGLAKATVWSALASLEAMKIVEMAGTGRARLYRLTMTNPLAGALEGLFQHEETRFSEICDAIRSAAAEAQPGVLAVWLYGSVARGVDRPDSDLDILVIAEPSERQRIIDVIRDGLFEPGNQHGFNPSLVGLEPADVSRLARDHDPWWEGASADAILLFGASPEEIATGSAGQAAA